MAGFKVPRYVEFLDELPLNATGKVMKDQARAEHSHSAEIAFPQETRLFADPQMRYRRGDTQK